MNFSVLYVNPESLVLSAFLKLEHLRIRSEGVTTLNLKSTLDLKYISQCHSNKASTVRTQKQVHRPVE